MAYIYQLFAENTYIEEYVRILLSLVRLDLTSEMALVV